MSADVDHLGDEVGGGGSAPTYRHEKKNAFTVAINAQIERQLPDAAVADDDVRLDP